MSYEAPFTSSRAPEPEERTHNVDKGPSVKTGALISKRESPTPRDMEEKIASTEAAANLVSDILKHEDEYKERIPLNRDRSLGIPLGNTEIPGHPLLNSAYRMEYTQKGLQDLAKDISKLRQEIRFDFKVDPEGKWIEIKAHKENLATGDMVIWEPDGAAQWREPKPIISIQADPKSGRKYALFEDSMTGVPLDELKKIVNKNIYN